MSPNILIFGSNLCGFRRDQVSAAIEPPSAHFSPDASADIPDPPGFVPTGRVPLFLRRVAALVTRT